MAEGFKLVGPAGFVLDKQQWIDQFRSGRLRVQTLDWDEVDVREHGEVAIAIGRQTRNATFQSQPAAGALRVTQVAVRAGGDWRLLGLHLSPIG
ncbi:MAG TPA: nuclear transport factor 2 family protein [Candidatus Dormibacteraeota bacterium]